MSKSSKEESRAYSIVSYSVVIFLLNLISQCIWLLQINIDPESLKPKLPSRKDLRPYPNSCYLEYKGHTGPVTSISTELSGQWIASGIYHLLFCFQSSLAFFCFARYQSFVFIFFSVLQRFN